MQPKSNQFHRQTPKTYSSQLHPQLNYQLKKSEQPGKTKRILMEETLSKSKNEKPSMINNVKKYPLKPKKTQSHEFLSEEINEEHINSNFLQTSTIPKIYENRDNTNRTGIFERGKSEKKLGRISIVERGKSLKYWKVDKIEPKLISQIKDFLNNLISDENGCSCGSDCKYGETLIKWAGVSEEKLSVHYERLLNLTYNDNDDDKSSRYGGTQISYNSNCESENEEAFQEKQRSKHLLQIQKDVVRTQAHSKVFKNKLIQDKMERILLCYSIEDPEVGYIQSMNIVMSGILYHVRSEKKTYAICRKLFGEIREIYLHDFKKCSDHIENVINIMKKYSFDLYTHLIKIGIDLKIVLFPWILSILCVIIPLEHMHRIYLGYISKGWKFVYQSILAIFLYHKDVLMEFDESGDLLVFLSASNPNKDQTDWQDIFDFENKLKIQFEL